MYMIVQYSCSAVKQKGRIKSIEHEAETVEQSRGDVFLNK